MFTWQSGRGAIDWALTDRLGGHSTGEHRGLNLGSRVGDDPAAVAANRGELAGALGLPVTRLVFLRQVHGADVAVLTVPPTDEPVADAVVTAEADLALVVLAADCVPVLLADPAAGVVGAAHVGRPGLSAGTVGATVTAMRDLGATTIDAVVGPAVCGRCYEVPAELQEQVLAVVPEARARSAAGTPALDIAAGVLAQLDRAGVTARREGRCTRESPELYSYRRDGSTGRHAGVIVRRAG